MRLLYGAALVAYAVPALLGGLVYRRSEVVGGGGLGVDGGHLGRTGRIWMMRGGRRELQRVLVTRPLHGAPVLYEEGWRPWLSVRV